MATKTTKKKTAKEFDRDVWQDKFNKLIAQLPEGYGLMAVIYKNWNKSCTPSDDGKTSEVNQDGLVCLACNEWLSGIAEIVKGIRSITGLSYKKIVKNIVLKCKFDDNHNQEQEVL